MQNLDGLADPGCPGGRGTGSQAVLPLAPGGAPRGGSAIVVGHFDCAACFCSSLTICGRSRSMRLRSRSRRRILLIAVYRSAISLLHGAETMLIGVQPRLFLVSNEPPFFRNSIRISVRQKYAAVCTGVLPSRFVALTFALCFSKYLTISV